MSHIREEDLILYHYGETDAEPIKRHLGECVKCRKDYDALQTVLGVAGDLPVPERGADYPQQVMRRLEARIGRPARTRVDWREWFRMPRLAFAGAMAGALVLAFVLGQFSGRTIGEPIPETVRERVLLVAVGDHLERSQRMLIEFVHAEGNGEVDISSQRQTAEALKSNNRLYKQTAIRNGDETIAGFLDELERLLVEIANSPDTIDRVEWSGLRNRIERQGILFKIRVIGNDAKHRESAAALTRNQI